MTISRMFYEQCGKTPNKVAVIIGQRQVTYAGLLEEVQRQAHIFRVNDLKRGDHLGVQLEGLDFIIALLAAADCGICLVPLPPTMPENALASALGATHCQAYINSPMEEHEQSEFRTRLKFEGKPDDLLLLITTSGSTGKPKPIMLKQKTKLRRVSSFVETYNITSKDTVLISTPLYHSMGIRLVLTMLLQGGTIVLMEHWDAKAWCMMVEWHQVTFAVPVAAQVHQIVKARPCCMSSLRFMVSSSAPLSPAAKEALPFPVYDCYGTTEVAIVTNGMQYAQGNPVSNAVVRLEKGEIVVNTSMLFDGYYDQPEVTAAAMTDDGFFRTGDIGLIDSAGVLHCQGRTKEIINVGGAKVFPQDVEEVVANHQGVVACAAFAYPDEHLGEVTALAVVPAAATVEEPTLPNLQRFCLSQLNDAQLPRKIFFIAELPKTETGKVQRLKLQEMFKNE